MVSYPEQIRNVSDPSASFRPVRFRCSGQHRFSGFLFGSAFLGFHIRFSGNIPFRLIIGLFFFGPGFGLLSFRLCFGRDFPFLFMNCCSIRRILCSFRILSGNLVFIIRSRLCRTRVKRFRGADCPRNRRRNDRCRSNSRCKHPAKKPLHLFTPASNDL